MIITKTTELKVKNMSDGMEDCINILTPHCKRILQKKSPLGGLGSVLPEIVEVVGEDGDRGN